MVKEDLSSARKRAMALLLEGELTSKKGLVFKYVVSISALVISIIALLK